MASLLDSAAHVTSEGCRHERFPRSEARYYIRRCTTILPGITPRRRVKDR